MSSFTPSRRGLLAASAWSVPAVVVATSAPAFATSNKARPATCVEADYLYNWVGSTWTYASTTTGVVPGTGAGVGFGYADVVSALAQGTRQERVKVTVTNDFTGNTQGLVNNAGKNMVVPEHEVGGLGHRGLELYQGNSSGKAQSNPDRRRTDSQIIQVSFDRPVSDLTFTIADIDYNSYQYADRVELSSASAYTAVRALKDGRRTVDGSGTSSSPWSGNAGGNIDHIKDGRGNVVVTFKGPVTSFTLRFWNADAGRTSWGRDHDLDAQGAQAIFLSNFNFKASTCM